MLIKKAINFILSTVNDPALASTELSKEIKNNVRSSKIIIERFKKIGDLYRYIKRFEKPPAPGESKVYDNLKKLGLNTYEDVVSDFESRFSNYFDEVTTLSDFIIGHVYTSWDIAIFARTYNCQSGIYLIGKKDNYQAIFIKATLNGGKYQNEWLVPDEELKYYMYSLKNNFNPEYKVNNVIINSANVPIYVFTKYEEKFTLSGIFSYAGYSVENDGSKWFRLNKNDSFLIADTISEEEYNNNLEKLIKKSSELPLNEREERLKLASRKPEQIKTIISSFKRNPDVITTILERANGICEGCNMKAPFFRAKDNSPYLEVHHVIPLGENGDDTVENAIALCPNCHRKAHFG